MFSSIGFIGTGTMGAAVARAAVKGAQGAPVLLSQNLPVDPVPAEAEPVQSGGSGP